MNNKNLLSNLSTQLIRAGRTVPCSMLPSTSLPEHGNIHGAALMLLKRLCKLEQLHARTKRKLGRLMKKIRAKDRKIAILKVKLNQVKVAASEFSESSSQYQNLNKKCKKLEKQLIDMKNFLKDYGLIWVGDEGNKNSNIADNTIQREQRVWHPDDSITSELVSFDLLLENIKYLNILANEGEAKITYTASGATFKDPISIPLTLYSDGLVLKSEPFRSYMEPSTQIFVVDILDGFFPTELQAQYPEGVSFKPPSIQQVIHNSISKYTLKSNSIVLKVWSEDGSKVYMIHISADETVRSLKKLLDENRKLLSARGGYCLNASNHIGRKTSLANTSLTLREYGITCNTVLFMQKVEAG